MDSNRQFANLLPHYAKSNGKTPAFKPSDQLAFNALCEGHSMPFVSQLWNLNLIYYREINHVPDGNIVIRKSAVMAAAVQFMTECKDCRYNLAYEVNAFNEARQGFWTMRN